MALPKQTMTVDVLADGTVKVETGDMGGVAHKSADQFLADLQKYLGGTVTETKVAQGHVHTHTHGKGGTHQNQ